MLLYVYFFAQSVFLYISSRYVFHELWHRLKKLLRSSSLSFYVLSILYLPGTLVHELSHLIMAVLLFVRPHSINLVPHLEESETSLHFRFGFVQHEKTDPIRSSLIGLSPLVAGFLFFYSIYIFDLFTVSAAWHTLVLVYLFFSVGSTMFPSEADLKDSTLLGILLIAGVIAVFLLNIDIVPYLLSPKALSAAKIANTFLLPASIINTILALLFLLTRRK